MKKHDDTLGPGIPAGQRNRFVHLGDRLLALGRIRDGLTTVAQVARELGVTVDDVVGWQQLHAFERTVSLEELRRRHSPQAERLNRRAHQLADLIMSAERELRVLHQEYIGAVASNEPYAGEGTDKKVG